MSLIRTEQFRAAVAEWARRHGVDPATIPEAAPFSRHPDGTWTVVDVNGQRITFAEREPFPTHVASKPRWRIVRASCACGGRWAWQRQRPSGAGESMGCVCHHPWTLALRAAT